ncbi:threonine-phosphate decarboxylase [Thalassobius sp. S69A]|uniref:threonine-phosphate decarboxylase n=1 Tax=unclassified Thalassovita TaxID=2619711 RepID=UPI000C0E74E8|nr:threonine-phosphate decarboxylase [Paracoccaceae bacterium]MBT24787.1 threonine-phosphate decarboxylase [Paracoccaceae bacterium]
MTKIRDHGGGIDAAVAQYGGTRAGWVDLSTGINPVPYPVPEIPADAWMSLPDQTAQSQLLNAARRFWNVPDGAQIVAAPGASALIANLPALAQSGGVYIPRPTYNEHAAAFKAHGIPVSPDDPDQPTHVYVHPNNPDGRLWPSPPQDRALTIIDESFCDVTPAETHIQRAARPGTVILKSFGKFWGLAGVRLGFAIAHPQTFAPLNGPGLADLLGPWAVSGPALEIGAHALSDPDWAQRTRRRLAADTARLDRLMIAAGAKVHGGTPLFRLYRVSAASAWQERLAKHRIWTRIFPYSDHFLRLGLPAPQHWARLETALS